jgi:hypothetical protein
MYRGKSRSDYTNRLAGGVGVYTGYHFAELHMVLTSLKNPGGHYNAPGVLCVFYIETKLLRRFSLFPVLGLHHHIDRSGKASVTDEA